MNRIRPQVLALDDDPQILTLIQNSLRRAEIEVYKSTNISEAFKILEKEKISLAIIDLLLADGDGLAVTKKLTSEYGIPVIILSGLGETTEKIVGLEVGADDYITKPFDAGELKARVRSVLRRSVKIVKASSVDRIGYSFGGWNLDVSARRLVSPNGTAENLTSGEYDLLVSLASRAGRVLTRNQIMDDIYGNDAPAFDRSIDVKVGRLRKILEVDRKKPLMIKTVRNIGYIFAMPVERQIF